MNPSKIPYSKEQRLVNIEILNQTIANLADLQSHIKNAHWNSKRILFYELHLLFDRMQGEYPDHIDTSAERLVAMGGVAAGTIKMAAEASLIPVQPNLVNGLDFVAWIIEAVVICSRYNLGAINEASRINDQTTLNLLCEIQATLDSHIYLLEAHVQVT